MLKKTERIGRENGDKSARIREKKESLTNRMYDERNRQIGVKRRDESSDWERNTVYVGHGEREHSERGGERSEVEVD